MRFGITNARCFHFLSPRKISPITILLGENSTGKTSFLALFRLAVDLLLSQDTPNFNKDPFFLGAFDQIAHYRGGRAGRSDTFELSIVTSIQRGKSRKQVDAVFTFLFGKRGSQPTIREFYFSCGDHKILISSTSGKSSEVRINWPSGEAIVPTDETPFLPFISQESIFDMRYFSFFLRHYPNFGMEFSGESAPPKRVINSLSKYFNSAISTIRKHPYAFGPVRSKPQRTYDPVDDTPRSEGEHVPMVMAKLRFTDRDRWERLTPYSAASSGRSRKRSASGMASYSALFLPLPSAISVSRMV